MTVLLPLVARHAEDAAFYWAHGREATFSSQHTPQSRRRFRHLLDANLEGLRVAQRESASQDGISGAGWQAVWARVQQWQTADEAFVAGVLALEAATAKSPRLTMLEALEQLACEQFGQDAERDIAQGLGHAATELDAAGLKWLVPRWLASEQPIFRRAALAAGVSGGLLSDEDLQSYLVDAHPLVRARALRAVGELGRNTLVDMLPGAIDLARETDAVCRYWAAISLCLLGRNEGIATLGRWTSENPTGALTQHALAVLAQRLPREILRKSLSAALHLPSHQRSALNAIRYSGDLGWLPVLLDLVEQHSQDDALRAALLEPSTNLARLAGDVLAHLTGRPLAGSDQSEALWQHAPAVEDLFEADEHGDFPDPASDPDVPIQRKHDPDIDLLWPDPAKLRRALASLGVADPTTDGQSLYLYGQALTPAYARQLIHDPESPQSLRYHAALYLRCNGHSETLIDIGR
ncbi:hypothetical protein FNU76_14800 [Chitinimonas arctica]|uniref:TIGR02270 family protein n=1 Tax=Chitinimonas arctica TaxID=2594795 RepID=A0A516SH85_9NEIS|nr:HEAT repeat domain-containing protein [Chitinimonas arctica]QDQ27523.1 hypothetical protein FNU76_14800 [Chitinimonas arctica]